MHEAYLECNGKWQESEFVLQLQKKASQRTKCTRRWMTRKQLEEKYDAAMADEIIRRKQDDEELRRTQIQKNPDNPAT